MKQKKNKVVIIDGNNMLYRAYYRYKMFTSKKNIPTGIIFGFPYILHSIIKHQLPTDVFVVFDGGRDKVRTELLPDYKKRDLKVGFDKDSFYLQKDVVEKILKTLGVKVISREKTEADDIIWGLAKKLRKDNQVVIVSSDKDFNQLISKNISVWNPKAGMRYHLGNIKSETGFEAYEWKDYLVLDGDKSDNIPGLKGVGQVRIRKFLDEFQSIESYLKSPVKELSGFKKNELEEVYLRNRILIDLRLFYRRYLNELKLNKYLYDPKIKEVDVLELAYICSKYEVTTFTKDNFISTFNKLLNNKTSCLKYLS